MKTARFQVRISVVTRKWVYCFMGRENGVFWIPVKIEMENFPEDVPLQKDQRFWAGPGCKIGKLVKSATKNRNEYSWK